MRKRLLREIKLRNVYRVYELDDGSYTVINIDRRGTRHEYDVPEEVADWLRDAISGDEVDKDEAADVLSTAAVQMGLPYTRDWQLGYFAQRVLLVLVARGEASMQRRGRRFVYTVF